MNPISKKRKRDQQSQDNTTYRITEKGNRCALYEHFWCSQILFALMGGECTIEFLKMIFSSKNNDMDLWTRQSYAIMTIRMDMIVNYAHERGYVEVARAGS